MPTQSEYSVVTQKTRELCQALLNQPEVRALRGNIETFMANDQARGQYNQLMAKGQALQEKQHSGQPLTDSEIGDFEKLRETFLRNPVARNFLDAQEDLQKLQQSVSQYVSKTFELGRVPEESELEEHGSCGHGCGCHH